MFFNPISQSRTQASISPLGGDLGPTRLTSDSAALDWSATTCRISRVESVGEHRGQKSDALLSGIN